MEAAAAVHGAAEEEVPVAEVPAEDGKAVGQTGKPVFFYAWSLYFKEVAPTMENLSAHLFSAVKR